MKFNNVCYYFAKLIFFLVPSYIFSVNVSTPAGLESAIITANGGGDPNINFTSSILYSQTFRPLNANTDFSFADRMFTINGNNNSLTSAGDFRGFFVRGGGGTGAITIRNITIASANARGGDGGLKGGGGAGLGGGLYVGAGAAVTLENATFSGCRATGGDSLGAGIGAGGGGGGLHGSGGATTVFLGGTGGGGFNAAGGGGTVAGGGGGGADAPGAAGTVVDGGIGGGDFTGAGGGAGGLSGSSGTAGLSGGGGGGSGFIIAGSSGGGGGFGGGGGGDCLAGIGGAGDDFGGGGGSPGGSVGAGGFGGGGGGGAVGGTGGTGGPGSFGGAGGAAGALGGGGAAMGGAIFIQAGGELTVNGGITFSGSSVSGGLGSSAGTALGTDIFMMSGSDIIFDITTDSIIPSPIQSDRLAGGGGTGGGLTKDGSALLSLTGANRYTGSTEIDNGTLLLNGSVITPVTVNGGTFTGIASIIVDPIVLNSADLMNLGGTVSPGNTFGTIIVEGSYTQGLGGTFHANVDDMGVSDLLMVSGSVDLDGTLHVETFQGNFIQGTTIPIITSGGGVSGKFLIENVPMTPWGTRLFGVNYLSNSVVLTVLDNVLFEFNCIASGNPQAVANYFINLLPIDPNSDLALVVEVLGLLDCTEMNKALNQLHPGLFGALEWINLSSNSVIASIFSEHLSELSCSPRGCRSGQPEGRRNDAWVHPFSHWTHQNKLSQLRGFHSTTVGVAAGYDRCFTNFYLGAGLAYSQTNLKWMSLAGNGQITSINQGLYGSYYNTFMTVDLSTFWGWDSYDLKRKISYSFPFPDAVVDRTAKNKHYGLNFTAHFGVTGDFRKWHVPMQTFVKVDYFYLYQNRFHEHGANSLNLRCEAENF